jgi:hypothetical protein
VQSVAPKVLATERSRPHTSCTPRQSGEPAPLFKQ